MKVVFKILADLFGDLPSIYKYNKKARRLQAFTNVLHLFTLLVSDFCFDVFHLFF